MAVTINASTSNGLIQTADTSGTLDLQSSNTTIARVTSTGVAVTGDISATGTVAGATGTVYPLVSGTAVPYTSFTTTTYNDFTGIPSWVKRITIMLQGISVSAGAHLLFQLGSGSVTTTGYLTYSSWNITTTMNGNAVTNGFRLENGLGSTANIWNGNYTFTNITGNIWTGTGISTTFANAGLAYSGGVSPSLAGTLDRVRLTTTSTDTFDAGTINILYE